MVVYDMICGVIKTCKKEKEERRVIKEKPGKKVERQKN